MVTRRKAGKKEGYFLCQFSKWPSTWGSGHPLPLAIAQGTVYQSTEEAGGYQFTRREEAEEEERKQTNY